jgi:hypothetical protein
MSLTAGRPAAAAVPRGWLNVIPHTVATTAASDKENCLFHTTQRQRRIIIRYPRARTHARTRENILFGQNEGHSLNATTQTAWRLFHRVWQQSAEQKETLGASRRHKKNTPAKHSLQVKCLLNNHLSAATRTSIIVAPT